MLLGNPCPERISRPQSLGSTVHEGRALYGVDAIPRRWRERLWMHDQIVELADALLTLATSIDITATS
jgi:hypothetical protein